MQLDLGLAGLGLVEEYYIRPVLVRFKAEFGVITIAAIIIIEMAKQDIY
jgi:hypothetical protein